MLVEQRPKIFYGWWVVLIAGLGLGLGSGPITVYAFGVFLPAICQEFHAGHGQVSLAFALHNLIIALCAPFVGRLTDAHGARRVILPATALFGLTLFLCQAIGSRIWQFYIFYSALGLLGISMGPVPYGLVVSRWFNRRRGLALGIMLAGAGLGAIVVPPNAHWLITAFGWRRAYAVLGLAVLVLPLPVAAALLREDPVKHGLSADGDLGPEPQQAGMRNDCGLSWNETWHAPTFWVLVAIFFTAGASIHACVIHLPALVIERGRAEDTTLVSSAIGMALLIGRLGSGYLVDRFFAPRVALALFSGVGAGIALLLVGSGRATTTVAALLIGLGMGAEVDLIAYLMSRYFGLKALGISYGFTFGAFVLSGAVGAFLMGAGFDLTHTHAVPLTGFLVAVLLACTLTIFLGPYRYFPCHAGPSRATSAKDLEVVAAEN